MLAKVLNLMTKERKGECYEQIFTDTGYGYEADTDDGRKFIKKVFKRYYTSHIERAFQTDLPPDLSIFKRRTGNPNRQKASSFLPLTI